MITIVGVAHVINLKEHIERVIKEENADIVAVELDYGRFIALSTKREGEVPFFYRKLGEMQKNLAEMFGTEVGNEMLTAVNTARVLEKRVAFIDMSSLEIIKRMKKNMSFWEKIRLYSSIFLAPISGRRLSKKEIKEIIKNEEKYIEYVKRKFPGFSKTLFEDREEYMANNLINLEKKGNVIAFVGDGHIYGLKKRIPHAKILRLKELIGDSQSFSFEVKLK